MPVGPDDDGRETIESLLLYLAPPVHVIAIDDSGRPATRRTLEAFGPAVTVLEPSGRGLRGGLWRSLANAYAIALERYTFRALLRIDTDALAVGYGAEEDAARRFAEDPSLGLLGSYRVDCNGGPRDFGPPARVIRAEAGLRGLVTDRARRAVLRRWLRQARPRGYEMGEHVLGAVYFLSPACLAAMAARGYLDADVFDESGISEDHLFALMAVAAGFRLGDHATDPRPMGVSWRGLPAPPEELLARGKSIVHSVKSHGARTERSVRGFFADRRDSDRAAGAARG